MNINAINASAYLYEKQRKQQEKHEAYEALSIPERNICNVAEVETENVKKAKSNEGEMTLSWRNTVI